MTRAMIWLKIALGLGLMVAGPALAYTVAGRDQALIEGASGTQIGPFITPGE